MRRENQRAEDEQYSRAESPTSGPPRTDTKDDKQKPRVPKNRLQAYFHIHIYIRKKLR